MGKYVYLKGTVTFFFFYPRRSCKTSRMNLGKNSICNQNIAFFFFCWETINIYFFFISCSCQVFLWFLLTCQGLTISDIFILRSFLVIGADGSLRKSFLWWNSQNRGKIIYRENVFKHGWNMWEVMPSKRTFQGKLFLIRS